MCQTHKVGVLLYALVTGALPYAASTLQNFITQILTQKPVIPIEDIQCSQHLKRFLAQLLEPTFFKRVDIQDAIKDPWLKVIFFLFLFFLKKEKKKKPKLIYSILHNYRASKLLLIITLSLSQDLHQEAKATNNKVSEYRVAYRTLIEGKTFTLIEIDEIRCNQTEQSQLRTESICL
ncbi:hypothetical protein RFI_38114, partial [Reticulomyxa filosa]